MPPYHSACLVCIQVGIARRAVTCLMSSCDLVVLSGAALLLRTHFERVHGAAHGATKLASFMELLRSHHIAVSFEMVTGRQGSGWLVKQLQHLSMPARRDAISLLGTPVWAGVTNQ
jgi:hypothetical protein